LEFVRLQRTEEHHNRSGWAARSSSTATMAGFMMALPMPYDVHDRGDLAKVGPEGDITADVVVPDNGSA
jgi:hypothetical protein